MTASKRQFETIDEYIATFPTVAELNGWHAHKIRKGHMDVTLSRLEHERAFIHRDNNHCFITETGMKYVEENIPLQI